MQLDKAILKNGGSIVDEAGNVIVSISDSGVVTFNLPDDSVSLENLDDGVLPGYVVRSASRHTWDEAAAAADVATLTGVEATDIILATINVRGANNPTTVLSAERSGANSVTVTLDQNGENGVTVVSVIALKAAA